MRTLLLAAVLLSVAFTAGAAPPRARAQDTDKQQDRKRPKITLKAQPTMGRAPLRVLFSAELVGGADDFEEYYCPTVVWEWSRGNASQSKVDCAPYEGGKSTIRRRYTVEHTFRTFGTFRVYVSLVKRDREVGTAAINVVVQPGGSAAPESDDR
jgi:hypothetical protein